MTEADLSEESDKAAWREERGRCQRPAPPALPGRGGSAAQGGFPTGCSRSKRRARVPGVPRFVRPGSLHPEMLHP